MSNFPVFKGAVAAQFAMMQNHSLFRVNVDKDELWDKYLNSFPPGTNEIFRERREYDCTCCRQFIRAVGDVVAIMPDGSLASIWGGLVDDPIYSVVTEAMDRMIKSHEITEPFVHYERAAGTDKSFEQRVGLTTTTWNHFHVNINARFVQPKTGIASFIGDRQSLKQVMLRSLIEIKMDAVDTVLELIEQGTLYRGTEHKATVEAFKKIKKKFDDLDQHKNRNTFVWGQMESNATRIRNTVIGTLLMDISEGIDLEIAVKSFETKVAPTNYKRPTALITQTMINKAKEQIQKLGLTSALERRYARLEDVSVSDILFADRSSKKISADVFDDISGTASAKPKNLDKVETITIDKFVSDVLPKIQTMEVMLEAKHSSNLVSLIAPSDPTAGNLFKWNNGFSWAYNGDVADSIKERVKQAGGNVTGDLCCRLAWDYSDDLDFHMVEPNFEHILYSHRRSNSGGTLDVDANGMDGVRDNPVENIFYQNRRTMREGVYHLYVHNFSRRDMKGAGFDVEIDWLGEIRSFHYDRAVPHDGKVTVAKFRFSLEKGIEIIEGLSSTQGSKQFWGLTSNQFHKVNTMMLSPNFWNEQQVGNKHFFFMLEGCKNEGEARGFFNEFLSNDLNEHRKVFEVVGSKMKATEGAESQLSGLGFSSTKRDELIVKVTGSFTRTLKIAF